MIWRRGAEERRAPGDVWIDDRIDGSFPAASFNGPIRRTSSSISVLFQRSRCCGPTGETLFHRSLIRESYSKYKMKWVSGQIDKRDVGSLKRPSEMDGSLKEKGGDRLSGTTKWCDGPFQLSFTTDVYSGLVSLSCCCCGQGPAAASVEKFSKGVEMKVVESGVVVTGSLTDAAGRRHHFLSHRNRL